MSSFPFFRIAKKYGISYEEVLAAAELYWNDPTRYSGLTSRCSVAAAVREAVLAELCRRGRVAETI